MRHVSYRQKKIKNITYDLISFLMLCKMHEISVLLRQKIEAGFKIKFGSNIIFLKAESLVTAFYNFIKCLQT